MRIVSAEYVISAPGPKQYPEGEQPEIAFLGRSNVGKSSLINRLVNRKALARTSGSPGKTRLLNFYHINGSFYFVDLPGYGFAKVSKDIKAQWGKMIEGYLLNRPNLRAVVQLIDIRHPPTNDDREMHEWLRHYDLPTVVVATKADKISRGNWHKHSQIIRKTLNPSPKTPLQLFSAESGQGKDELWGILTRHLNETNDR